MFEGIGIQLTADTADFVSGMRNAGRELDTFGGRVKDSETNSGALATTLRSAFIGGGVVAGIAIAANTVRQFTDSMVQAQISVDKLRNGLTFAVGAGNVAAELEFVKASARNLGLEFNTTAEQYMKLAAAARGTSLEGQKTRDIFSAIAQASTVMGLSAQEAEGALTAVAQMISKGKVQAEELRGQLGERLPGAFQIAARAMGMTTTELDKMLESGQLLASDFLPKFAAQLTNEVAPSVDEASRSMQASVNRLSTAWTDFKQTVAEAGVSSAIRSAIGGIATDFEAVSDAMKNAKKEGAGFFVQTLAGVTTAIGRGGFGMLSEAFNVTNSALNTLSGGLLKLRTNLNLVPEAFDTNAQKAAALDGKLTEATTKLQNMRLEFDKRPSDIYLQSEIYQTQLYVQELQRAKTALGEITGGGAGRGRVNPETVAASLEAKAQREASYKAALTTYATDSEKLAAEIAKQKAALGDLYTPELEARIRKHFIKPVKDASDDYGRLGATIARELDLANEQLLAGSRLTESDKFRIKTLSQIDESLRKGNITKAQALTLEEQMTAAQQKREEVEKAAAQRRANIAQYQDQIAFQSELDAAYVADSKAREQARLTVDAYEKSIRDSNNMLALEASLMGQSATVREATLEQYRIELELKKQIDAIDRSAGLDEAQREELRARARVAAASASAQATTKARLEVTKKDAEQIQQTLTDAIMRGFENGKGFVENFRDTVENMFKTLVLRPIVSAIVTPVAGLITGGLPGTAAAGQGGALGTVNTAVQAKSLYDTVSGAFTTLGESISTSAATMGKWLIENTSDALQQAGNSLYSYSGTIGTAGAYAGGAFAGYGLGTAISNGRSAAGDGNGDALVVAGTALGAIFGGPVGAAIGGAIGGAINAAFGQGAKTVDATGIQGTFSGSMFSGQSYQQWSRSAGWFNSGDSGTDYRALDSSYASKLGQVYGALTSSTAQLADSLGQPTSQILGYVKSIRIDSSQLTESGLQAVFEGIADELARTVVTSGYIKEGERASVALSRLSTSLATVNGAFNTLNKAALTAGLSTADAASQLLDMFGGADAFNTATLSYYQNYYTEAERNAKTTENLVKSFASLGVAMPDSTATFRALVDAQDITTASGRTTYTALMGLQEAFAAVTKAAEDSAKSLIKTANYATYADYAAAMAAAGGTAAARFDGGDLSGGSLLALSPALMTATASSSTPAAAQVDAATAAEVQALREENRAQSLALARIMERFAQIIETWDAIGMPAVQPE
ncbi:hypothetical protein AEP_00515 [Curvibacter sp. AEP1-3]|uniref:tape measure protein n=1 Tax=Curvibacter sp. AEP1-3 TaxID=1844971 RepID=UPI000B3CD9CB|nr:tape measure protein [Curvibacter sp. AEP1-3]ARV17475.1 hypothetical protein AEP_00515 [Curvibacter sp. AEP1-3]